MAYATNALFSSTTVAAQPRVMPKRVETVTFAAGSGTLAVLTPVCFNLTTANYQIWTGKSSTIYTITAAASANTGGNFTITVNGVTTGNIAHNASVATIKTALVAANACDEGDVTVTETGGGIDANNGVLTLTFGGNLAHKALTVDANLASLTGGSAATKATAQAGLNLDNAGDTTVKGFIFPNAVTLAAGGEVLGVILLEGEVDYSDIVLPAGETESVLQAALRSGARTNGLAITGLTQTR